MKTLKIILLTTLISFLIFIFSVFVIFKFFITPERINRYLETSIEKSIKNKLVESEFNKSENNLLNELYTTSKSANYKYSGNELDDIKILEKLVDLKQLKNMKIFDNLNDINYISSQLSSNVNMKMDLLKYKINEYFSKKNIKEE